MYTNMFKDTSFDLPQPVAGVQIVRTARRGVSRKIRTLTSRRAPLSERLEQARSSALIH